MPGHNRGMNKHEQKADKLIIIGGGVGPMAGLKLQEKIIRFTHTSGSDQDHIDTVHICRPSLIEDRTGYLFDQSKENPGIQMALLIKECADAALASTKHRPEKIICGVPCNTFHSAPVWDAFTRTLGPLDGKLDPVHMIEVSIQEIQKTIGTGARIGILSTLGTAKSGVWDQALTAAGYLPVQVEKEGQKRVHEAIYNPEWGLKAKSPASLQAVSIMEEAAEELVQQSCSAIVLGCTEIPLALEEGQHGSTLFIDPVSSLAKALIQRAGASLRGDPI